MKNVLISKQFENSENYQEFLKIVKEKSIKVTVLQLGTRINIEKDLYFDVLWPNSSQVILENSINNNALVCKLNYKKFSMLFTGDIEEGAEQALLENKVNLKADILKVAHHGSKSSSGQKFIENVKPKIALIGVGKNNNFGHPNNEIIDRLKNVGSKIYRTDLDGEIQILVSKGKIKVKTR